MLVLPGAVRCSQVPSFLPSYSLCPQNDIIISFLWELPMFVETKVSYSICKQKMMSFRGQASYAERTSPGGKLTLACHPTKKVNKAEELTSLFTNIGNN
jgi:hypothetical protein